jgi:hypothetical protein
MSTTAVCRRRTARLNQGLFNRATLTQPGQPGRDADACGDLPNIAHDKEFVSATAAAGDTWDVVYRITVNNNGGASGDLLAE